VYLIIKAISPENFIFNFEKRKQNENIYFKLCIFIFAIYDLAQNVEIRKNKEIAAKSKII